MIVDTWKISEQLSNNSKSCSHHAQPKLCLGCVIVSTRLVSNRQDLNTIVLMVKILCNIQLFQKINEHTVNFTTHIREIYNFKCERIVSIDVW